MAHRTGFGAGITLIAAMFPPRLGTQAEEREPVPGRARRRSHRRAQRSMYLAVVLEAVLPDADDDVLAAVTPHQHRAGNRQPRVLGGLDALFASAPRVQFSLQEVLRSANTQVGVVGDLQCPLPRSFRQATPSVRLQPPSDPPE